MQRVQSALEPGGGSDQKRRPGDLESDKQQRRDAPSGEEDLTARDGARQDSEKRAGLDVPRDLVRTESEAERDHQEIER